jgi:hypothetical protein
MWQGFLICIFHGGFRCFRRGHRVGFKPVLNRQAKDETRTGRQQPLLELLLPKIAAQPRRNQRTEHKLMQAYVRSPIGI